MGIALPELDADVILVNYEREKTSPNSAKR
jgi:hypothetical protein